ncbi:MAG TPA: hypothetical protein VIN10_01880 [Bacteroidales bacterium]
MKQKTKILFILFLIALQEFPSCQKIEEFPDYPIIKYENFLLEMNTTTGITERGVLIFSYTDGNADLGLKSRDTFPPFNPGSPYYYNLIINYFEQINGEFVEVPLLSWDAENQQFDTITFNARFPDLTPLTGNLNIKGVFQDTLFIYNPLSQHDTIKFSAYIYDRALNKSNVIETPPIVRVQ